MIRSEAEYKEAVRRIAQEEQRLAEQQAKLEEMKLGPDEVRRAMDPIRSFHMQLVEEVQSYEKLRRGEFDEVRNLQGVGTLLIAARIFQGLSQRELAQCLGVHESQVSRDERNEYHNITLQRAAHILDILGIELRSNVEFAEQQEVVSK